MDNQSTFDGKRQNFESQAAAYAIASTYISPKNNMIRAAGNSNKKRRQNNFVTFQSQNRQESPYIENKTITMMKSTVAGGITSPTTGSRFGQ